MPAIVPAGIFWTNSTSVAPTPSSKLLLSHDTLHPHPLNILFWSKSSKSVPVLRRSGDTSTRPFSCCFLRDLFPVFMILKMILRDFSDVRASNH